MTDKKNKNKGNNKAINKINKIDYDNVEDLINVLYDFAYNKNSKNHYRYVYIPKHKIEAWQYKKDSNFDWDQVFNTEIKLIGEKNGKIIFKRYSNSSFATTLTVGFYPAHTNKNKDYDINDINLEPNI